MIVRIRAPVLSSLKSSQNSRCDHKRWEFSIFIGAAAVRFSLGSCYRAKSVSSSLPFVPHAVLRANTTLSVNNWPILRSGIYQAGDATRKGCARTREICKRVCIYHALPCRPVSTDAIPCTTSFSSVILSLSCLVLEIRLHVKRGTGDYATNFCQTS